MLEFITKDTNLCPYCRGELRDVVVDDVYKKFCKCCYKMFEIAYFRKAQPWDVITLDDDIQWKKNATCEINAQVQKE